MPSGICESLKSLVRRRNRSLYHVGDVTVENTIPAASLEVTPTLAGDATDPGYNSQPVGYAITASYKGACLTCTIPASHDGVPAIVFTDRKPRIPLPDKGYHLTGVRVMEGVNDDPLVGPEAGVQLRLTFTYKGSLAEARGHNAVYDFQV